MAKIARIKKGHRFYEMPGFIKQTWNTAKATIVRTKYKNSEHFKISEIAVYSNLEKELVT